MTPERYQRINALADAALDLPPEERAEFLDRACAEDAPLREQVQHLVDAHSSDDDFLQAPVLEVLAKDLAAAPLHNELGGRQIHQYRVISRLGAGGIGEVWLARDTQLTREVALKLLSPQFAGDPYHVRRFRLEARAASTLNHPNIVTIYEIGRADGVDFIAQEFVAGQTVRQRLASGRFELREVLEVGLQICSALAAAHKAGIVHRDIKPENVMMRPDGLVKVLDFGLARFVERLPAAEGESAAPSLATGPGFVLGTVRYMSPEQARGLPVDSRSDLFSLGVLLHEMATGAAPFSGPTPADVLAAILTFDPPPASRMVPQIPPEFDRLVRQCLEKNPQARCASAGEAGAELGRLARGLESKIQPQPLLRNNRRPGFWWVMGGAAAVIAILVLALYVLFVRPVPGTSGRMQISELNFGGDVAAATISPDGRYAAYVLNEAGGQSIWNMQLATGSRIRLMPPEGGDHTGLAFSGDGGFLYFLGRQGAQPDALYRLPTLGGPPVRLTENVGEGFSVSPDGKRVAFVRIDRLHQETTLLLAGLGGGALHQVALRRRPQYFSQHGLAWSPDQQFIACFAGETNDISAPQFHLAQVRVADGSMKTIGNHAWRWVANLVWPAKSKVLAFIATEQLLNFQLWTASPSNGAATRITNDVSDYSMLSAAADGQTFLALQSQTFADLWVAPANDYSAPAQITAGSIHGFNTLNWTPDGRIIYSAMAGSDGEIWITDADGHNVRQLATGPGNKSELAVTYDQRYILYQSLGHIWRLDLNGTNARQLTHGILEVHPVPSTDGQYVLYASFNEWSPGLGGKPTIWKVPIDGGEPVQVSQEPFSIPRISPDGQWIAGPYFPDWQSGTFPRMAAILDSAGHLRKAFGPLPAGQDFYVWMPGGDAISYEVEAAGVGNIWRQSLRGGPPVAVTHFNRDEIFDYAWSRDRRLALARGQEVHGVAMIRFPGN